VSEPAKDQREDFHRAVRAATRAIAGEPELMVAFEPEEAQLLGKDLRLPDIPPKFTKKDIRRIRGTADSYALKIRYHNEKLHKKQAPAEGGVGRMVFDALEQVRVEALGARDMKGVAQNLNSLRLKDCVDSGLMQAEKAEEVPLKEALGLIVRQRLTGEAIPPEASGPVKMIARFIEKKAGSALDDLEDKITDQVAFADALTTVLKDLDLIHPTKQEDAEETDGDDTGGEDTEDQPQDEGDEATSEQGVEDERSEGADDDAQGRESIEGDDMDLDDSMASEEAPEDGEHYRPNHPLYDLSRLIKYKVFTNEFDETIGAEHLTTEEELKRLRAQLDRQLDGMQGAITKLANRLQRKLMAKQNRSWEFDLEEGVLDAGRLARVVANPTTPLSFKMETDTNFKDTVVTLLIDNSGSMRGRPISTAAICGDILARTLERCGVNVEILGFTTKEWKGGRSRDKWLREGKPKNVGRLNDLRHIIYKTADMPYRRAKKNLGLMMKEGILKENIDGEALLWAHNRLLGRPEDRRILMVISDGAPVDDSTLSVNKGTYLETHLRQIIQWIETRSNIELSAIGIGHDVTRYYSRAVTISDPEELGGAMMDQLTGLFDEEVKR
jgi:cobaltochelatase CobT